MYLRVKVGGHPPPSLTWYHDGRKVTADYATELDEDGGISFPSVEAKHAGEYMQFVHILVEGACFITSPATYAEKTTVYLLIS